MKVHVHSFRTGLGVIRCASTGVGLVLVALPGKSEKEFKATLARLIPVGEPISGGTLNEQAERQIQAYLSGKLRAFKLRLDILGTPFQKLALQQVASIPYGRTMTYRQVAEAIGHPLASRAVGNVNAQNNLPLVIPCHRVVASNGLGGYGGGAAMKMKLLHLEGALQMQGELMNRH